VEAGSPLTEPEGDALVDRLRADCAALLEAFRPSKDADADHQMLTETVVEATAHGIEGMLDDESSLVRPWGFDVADIAVPTKIMAARDDELIPQSHGRWLATSPLPNWSLRPALTLISIATPRRRNSLFGWPAPRTDHGAKQDDYNSAFHRPP
jgi:hypothetical protein